MQTFFVFILDHSRRSMIYFFVNTNCSFSGESVNLSWLLSKRSEPPSPGCKTDVEFGDD
jgi:hypothetical protein